MRKSFTLEDLARYSLEVYLESQRNLARAVQKTGPSGTVIRNVLQYSKVLRVSHTASGGPVFLIMN